MAVKDPRRGRNRERERFSTRGTEPLELTGPRSLLVNNSRLKDRLDRTAAVAIGGTSTAQGRFLGMDATQGLTRTKSQNFLGNPTAGLGKIRRGPNDPSILIEDNDHARQGAEERHEDGVAGNKFGVKNPGQRIRGHDSSMADASNGFKEHLSEADANIMIRKILPLLRWMAAGALIFLAACTTVPGNWNAFSGNDAAIMGQYSLDQNHFISLALEKNPSYGRANWTRLYQAYLRACRIEGVSQAAALTQLALETGWMRFGGTVKIQQNNFAGLGTVDTKTPGLSFPDVETGALAHVQHLKAYASQDPPQATLVDPRFRYVRSRGSSPTLRSLAGKWAADPAYGDKLMAIYEVIIR